MEIQLKIIGIGLMVLALIHVVFPKYFNWSENLKSLSLINREMMYVHTLFIGLTIFLMGILCLTSVQLMLETELGKRICLGLGIFWFVRLLVQFFGYSPALWKGKTFETIIHLTFIVLWSYLSLLFFLVWI